VSISLSKFEDMLNFKEGSIHTLVRSKVVGSLLEFRSIAAELIQGINRMLTEITAIGSQILERYTIQPRPKTTEDYLKLTGD
jgi:hypothetical protein